MRSAAHLTTQPRELSSRPAESTSFLQVAALRKTYDTQAGDRVEALAAISMDLGDGEFVSVLGPSGCGKTTLLKILAGIVPHSHGEVLLRGRPISGPQADMGIVFQSPVLLPWLTVLENVLLPVKVLRLDPRRYRDHAEELLQLVGLEGFANKFPSELSGGMQQRAAIVRGLVHDPQMLLMDEPFGALDALTRERMNVELQRIWLANRKTIFFITHSIAEAVFLSDRVLVMSQRPGRIIEELRVPFSRPRDIDMTGTAEFGALTKRLRHTLGGQGDGQHE